MNTKTKKSSQDTVSQGEPKKGKVQLRYVLLLYWNSLETGI